MKKGIKRAVQREAYWIFHYKAKYLKGLNEEKAMSGFVCNVFVQRGISDIVHFELMCLFYFWHFY